MITLIIGRQGSGKTLFLVKKAYEYYLEGKTIYSNIKLNFPFKQIDYDDIVNCRLKNSVVILDEIHLLLSARNSMSKMSRLICDGFLSMVRKMGLTILASTQTERKVDVRFREEKDFLIACNKYVYTNKKWTEVLHSQNLNKKIPIMICMDIREEFSMKWITMSFLGNKFFDLYDTTEVVKVKGLNDDEDNKTIVYETKNDSEVNKLKTQVKKLKDKLSQYKGLDNDMKILDKIL